MATDKKALVLIVERAKGRCEICGRHLGGEYVPHHRLLKSRGGKDQSSNLLHICHACHAHLHSEPEWATKNGFMVPSWKKSAEVPFFSWRGWRVLHDDGTQERLTDLPEY